MLLKDILKDTEHTLVSEGEDIEIENVVYDSRKVTKGSLFIALTGANSDGHKFIGNAIDAGAIAVVVEHDVPILEGVTVIKVENSRKALASIAAAWFGYPAKKLTLIGITGTKGKTTTSYMTYGILKEAGIKCGLIGTIEVIIGDKHIHSLNTTPESYLVQEYFKEMVDAGITHVVMEVSSQALKYHRVEGINYDIGIFTNIEPDHIGAGEHTDFNDYMNAKAKLFKQCKVGIINADAEHLDGILPGHTCEVKTFGLAGKNNPDYAASNTELTKAPGVLGVSFDLTHGNENEKINVDMPGAFSVHNALGAIAATRELGISYEAIKAALAKVRVNGRVEIMPVSPHFTVIIDYAHNAMGLESILTTLKAYHPKRLVTVFGCGGNRARDRRFSMGEVSSRLSDLSVVTSDNPRFEEPMDIINDILTGIAKADGKYNVIPDRAEAIKKTILSAKEGDVIVIAGKGHEDYQEIKGVRHHMDDYELVLDAAKELK